MAIKENLKLQTCLIIFEKSISVIFFSLFQDGYSRFRGKSQLCNKNLYTCNNTLFLLKKKVFILICQSSYRFTLILQVQKLENTWIFIILFIIHVIIFCCLYMKIKIVRLKCFEIFAWQNIFISVIFASSRKMFFFTIFYAIE